MAENQLQTAIKFIYGVHTKGRRGGGIKTLIITQHMNRLSSDT